jgi:outer membrane protein assembly factor BamB
MLAAEARLAEAQTETDWPSYGGDSQRSGWEKSDTRITRDNVKNFELVWKRKFAYTHTGPRSLTPPVIVGLLISYRGFKELAFVGDASGTVWSVDADLNRIFWKRQLEPLQSSCGTGVASMPALVPPVEFRRAAGGAHRRPALPGNGFGEVRPVFAVSNDGKLHRLNTSDGTDLSAPLEFLPANVKASPLTIHDGTIYASTVANCGGRSGIWAIDLTVPDPHLVSYTWQGTGPYAPGGPAIGNDGTVYLQTDANTIQSFTANELKPKTRLDLPANPSWKTLAGLNVITPIVFEWSGRDVLVSAGGDGRLFVVDGHTFEGAPLSETLPLATAGGGIWGGLSSWKAEDGTIWVLAPVWGKLNPDLKAGKTNGDITNGAIVAFRIEEHEGKPVLTPAWISRDLHSPVPPVMTNGAVFVLSSGPGTATLYGLDAQTGEVLYSSGNQVKSAATSTGLTVSNGRVYFATADGTLYAFGVHMEI